jgi:hypothetical protein
MRVKKPDSDYKTEWYVVLGMVILGITVLFLAFNAKADYVYEGSQDLYDLQTNSSGSTGLGSNDDSVSSAFDLGFTFTFYGNDYTQARMATNGCLHFNLTGSYCGDYTPDPLPQYTNTLFVFWTDLIKDGGSAMKAKAFDDYTIFGWYNMREYNRANSDNSIEVWLYPNDTYEYRYGELDIISHDVLIGEQGSSSQLYTYHFFDECNTGTTDISGTCVNYDWNSSSNAVNTLLEDGGSLYGDGTDQSLCATVPLTSSNCAGYAVAYMAQQCALNSLYDEDCTGYAAAYLTQQCNVTQLYSQECPSYWSAYDDQQCDDDPQYSPSCAGYTQEASVAYYQPEEEYDYGYNDPFTDSCIDNPDYCYDDDPYAGMYFTDAEWYEIDLQEFGQIQVDEWYGTDVSFNIEGWIEWDSSPLDTWNDLDLQMDIFDYEEANYYETEYMEVFDAEELVELYEFATIIEEEFIHAEEVFVEFETIEELDEWFEEEMAESIQEERFAEEEQEEEIFEEEVVEEIYEDLEEEWIAEEEMTIPLEESEDVEVVGTTIEREEKSSRSRETALNVVANALRTATNSVGGITAGTSVHATGNTVTSGNTGTSSAMTSSSTGGMSTSSSPSRSDQFASASVQTQQVLSLSGDTGVVTNVSVVVTPMPGLDDNPQVVMADVQVQDMRGEIDTAVGGVMTASEADQIADKIIAQNIKEQQEEGVAEQESTGEYGDESTLIAYLGYVPGFDAYKEAQIPKQETWYKSKEIYADAFISDNINAFYGLARTNLSTMNALISSQPNL